MPHLSHLNGNDEIHAAPTSQQQTTMKGPSLYWCVRYLPRHLTPASYRCASRLSGPYFEQSKIVASSPLQATSSKLIFPLPSPKTDHGSALAAPPYPRLRQTTVASFRSQPCWVTVPHAPWWNTSTLPSHGKLPPTSLTSGKINKTRQQIG